MGKFKWQALDKKASTVHLTNWNIWTQRTLSWLKCKVGKLKWQELNNKASTSHKLKIFTHIYFALAKCFSFLMILAITFSNKCMMFAKIYQIYISWNPPMRQHCKQKTVFNATTSNDTTITLGGLAVQKSLYLFAGWHE